MSSHIDMKIDAIIVDVEEKDVLRMVKISALDSLVTTIRDNYEIVKITPNGHGGFRVLLIKKDPT